MKKKENNLLYIKFKKRMEKKNYKFKNKKSSVMKFSKNLFEIKVHHNNSQ